MAVRFRTKATPTGRSPNLELFCDGSAHGWGWCLALPGQAAAPLEGQSGVAQGPTTSNRMELEGMLRGLERVLTDPTLLPGALLVRSDSAYAIGVADGGHQARANLDLVQALRTTIAELRGLGVRVRLRHIKAHAGHAGNEYADQLAGLWRP
jgi:ribonuclease HI